MPLLTHTGYCPEMTSTSTQPCLAEGSPQMDWLTKDLASVDRTKTPWVIAVFHQPYVNSNDAHSMETEGAPMQKAVEEVLNQYHVDLVFSGHVHAYERSNQVYQYKNTPGAPYYITIGDGGNLEGLASTWVEPQPAWSAFRQASYGFGELRVVDSTKMEWRCHQNQDLLPTIADTFTFTKDPSANLRGSAPAPAQPETGKPVFADNERGRRAAEYNAQQTKLSARAQH
jgi:3',5'-cyclic AMP phosphodiesterase CpdA